MPEQVVLDPHVGVEGGEVEGRGGLRHVCDATHARPSVVAIVRGSAADRAHFFQTTFSGLWVMLTTGFGALKGVIRQPPPVQSPSAFMPR